MRGESEDKENYQIVGNWEVKACRETENNKMRKSESPECLRCLI